MTTTPPAGTTYRDRREARAGRLDEWATKRDAKAAAARARTDAISSGIPFGQPILVGHRSEARARRDQERIRAGFTAEYANATKAQEMRSRADNIRRQADRAIYSDDPDAVEALEARIADLVAARDSVRTFNARVRKAKGDPTVIAESLTALSPALQAGYTSCRRAGPAFLGSFGEFPGYVGGNLSGNIKRNRDRLERMT